MDAAKKEANISEDKLATTLYTIQAKEKDFAINIVDALKAIRSYFQDVVTSLDTEIPCLEEKVRKSKRTRVYGEELSTHLRYEVEKKEINKLYVQHQ